MFDPKYQITDDILTWLSDIAEIRGKIAQAKLLPVRETILRRQAIVKMTHSSTSIEGNTLSEAEVNKLASKQSVFVPAKDRLEVENYFTALAHMEKLSSEKQITLGHILSLQKLVMHNLTAEKNIGTIRTTPVYIVNSRPGFPDQIIYTPPTAIEVEPLLIDLLKWRNSNLQIHPIIRAGILHHRFESIHPFTDGNGRTGRLLTLLSLYQSGWDFRRGLVLEEYYNLDRRSYYLALQEGGSDLTSWLSYFSKGFWVESLGLQESINSLLAGTGSLTSRKLDSSDLRLIDFVVTLGKITSSDVCDILSIPLRTAQSRLARLTKFQIFRRIGSGRSTYYKLAKVK
ncbi:Fic family protein [Candidatus Woesebacteria bacterium]|nr:Fic family protein [Candidatus Woesebacteria bacterium]